MKREKEKQAQAFSNPNSFNSNNIHSTCDLALRIATTSTGYILALKIEISHTSIIERHNCKIKFLLLKSDARS